MEFDDGATVVGTGTIIQVNGKFVATLTTSSLPLGSHSITADRSLAEQARDAEWFDADALIVTGSRLADPPLLDDVRVVRDATNLAIVVGSGVTADNVASLFTVADAAIIGSALKEGGVWWGAMSQQAVERIVAARELGHDHRTGSQRRP